MLGSDISISSDDHLNADGWLRHAPEYYRVATLMLDKMSSSIGTPKDDRTVTFPSSVSQLEELLELVI
jgi:hypothetical protein